MIKEALLFTGTALLGTSAFLFVSGLAYRRAEELMESFKVVHHAIHGVKQE